MKLWLCGKFVKAIPPIGVAWEFQGIFETEAEADGACVNERYFYVSVELGERVPDETIVRRDARYPRIPRNGFVRRNKHGGRPLGRRVS